MSIILGVNAYHGDSSACILIDGVAVAAIEEERLRRVKHWAGFPSESIRFCLKDTGVGPEDIDHIAFSSNPTANLHRRLAFAVSGASLALLSSRVKRALRMGNVANQLSMVFGVDPSQVKARVHRVEHHRSHSASAFLVSPFEEAAVVSIDAIGDFLTTMVSSGEGNHLKVLSTVGFPHSLGILYTAVTQYLGFHRYGDEYKVMGLAAYGSPTYLDEFRKIVSPKPGGAFQLAMKYFLHESRGMKMTWDNCEPTIDRLYSDYMVERLGLARESSEDLTGRHQDIAASLQAVLEEVYFHVLKYAHEATGKRALALAGGVSFNSVANGKIFDHTPFEDVYIQAAAGDAGTALGAASYVYHVTLDMPRKFIMTSPYMGPQYDDQSIEAALSAHDIPYCRLLDDELWRSTAQAIADGRIVGWFQGRAEWGPRALGNRSILVDPRRNEMKDILNERIKRRESFRPFAPSVLVEAVGEYFERSYPDPFMIKVYPIRPEKRPLIPAVTHFDGTGRLQTVSRDDNERYWRLIKGFGKITGAPVLLNTSFNENEPIVCSPDEAIDCFLRTKMDVLVLGNYFVTASAPEELATTAS